MAMANMPALEEFSKFQASDNPSLDMESLREIKMKKSKILIAGDSWAFFLCIYNSMGKMIRDKQVSLIQDNRCWRTSKVGLTAAEWMSSRSHKRTLKFLKNTPRIKYLYLSLGGNDMLRNWNKDFTPEQEVQLFEQTTQTLQKIMDSYLEIRPGLKIILAGYDYPNFTFRFTLPLYNTIYDRMHRPDPEYLNKTLVRFTQYVSRLSNGKNIFFIHSLGLAQYYDGVLEEGLAARQTTPPDQISPMNNPSAIGGTTAFQTSRKSMIHWLFVVRDAFHLNTRMYRKVLHHAYDNLLVHLLRIEKLENQITLDTAI